MDREFVMKPTIWVGALEEMMAERFPSFNRRDFNLRQMMFDDQYMNDVYCLFSLSVAEENIECARQCYGDNVSGEQKEQWIMLLNLIDLLREKCPGHDEFLIDVMW